MPDAVRHPVLFFAAYAIHLRERRALARCAGCNHVEPAPTRATKCGGLEVSLPPGWRARDGGAVAVCKRCRLKSVPSTPR